MIQRFGFLYCPDDFWNERREGYRLIKARNIISACNKMLRILERLKERHSHIRIDHEVDFNGFYIDLYKVNHPIQEYLP